jgi:hypothetical protein
MKYAVAALLGLVSVNADGIKPPQGVTDIA